VTRCRNQLDQCAQDIRSCQAEMAQACKQLKEEERQVRVSRANKSQHLTRRLQKLRIAERELYFELAFLRELKRRNQSEENEGMDQKQKIEKEISKLTMSSCGTLKMEAFDSSMSSSTSLAAASLEKTDERIQRRERNLAAVKERLTAIWKEEKSLNERIQIAQTNLDENRQNLSDLRQDLEKLRALSGFQPAPSETYTAIVARIKKLKESQRGFIKRFAGLEVELLKLQMNLIEGDILEKGKEWIDLYGCGEEEV